MGTADRIYFAAKQGEALISALREKIETYYDWLRSSGRLSLWEKTHRQYYAGLAEGGEMGEDGEQGELVKVNANDFRNLGQHLTNMASAQRPHFDPRAVNSDHRSQTQTILGAGILEFVLKEKRLGKLFKRCLRTSLLMADAYLAVDWDANAGRDYAVSEDGSSTVKTGDLALRTYTPLDVVRDVTKASDEEHQWYIARRWVNRYDLAARHPELAEQILAMDGQEDPLRPRRLNPDLAGVEQRQETDDVEVFDLYHDRTAALPDGRKVSFLLGVTDGVLFDGPLPYDDLSLYRLSPETMIGSSDGYSPLYDLLSLQQGQNAAWSTVASNNAAFGVQNLWAQEGDNVSVTDLGGGLKLVQSRVKPEPLQMTASAPETYKLLELFQREMETISGVNSVARGNPEASLKSGAALALVQAQAIQFSADLQEAWVEFLEQVATGILRVYKRFAQAPQVALIVGRANKGFVHEFKGSDLDRVDRVAVDLGNPLSRTVAGRVQMADSLLERALIKTPEEYIQVVSTGRLEPVLEATQKEMLAIKSENERFSDAKAGDAPVVAVLTDNHPAHMREHAAVISSPEAREVPGVVQTVLAHIEEHANLWQTMPPALAMALQIPPPAGMMAAPPAPGTPAGAPPPPGSEPGPMPPPPGLPAEAPNMPQMPQNPLTGERAPDPTAAMPQ